MSPATAATKDSEASSFNEYKAVEAAIQPYIEAARTGDGKLSTSTYFEHARIVGSEDGGKLCNMDLEAFENAVSSLGPAAEIQHHIAWIDISGPAAAAKVEFHNWAGYRFTDYFVLFKDNGDWKISGKVYDAHSNN